LVAAEYGLPTGFMTMASCLTTGPATLAGTLAVGNAEVVAGTALLQLAYPGAPVFYAAAQTASDPRTGVYTGGGPEDSTLTFVMRLYKVAFVHGRFELGFASALAYSLAVFIFAISLLVRRLNRPVE